MKPIRVMIADDNEDSIEIIKYFIQPLAEFELIGICEDGQALLEEVMVKSPDLVLVDINMPQMNGMDCMKKCLTVKPALKFIFITGYDEFAVKAFELSAVDYIVKPLEKTRLYIALERAKQACKHLKLKETESETSAEMKRLPVKFNGSIYYVPIEDIIFIEKSGKKCFIYTKAKVYETYENIGDLYSYLTAQEFFQTHRSYIVNFKKISHITPKNETYLVYFFDVQQYAHISKLKIQEVQQKLQSVKEYR